MVEKIDVEPCTYMDGRKESGFPRWLGYDTTTTNIQWRHELLEVGGKRPLPKMTLWFMKTSLPTE